MAVREAPPAPDQLPSRPPLAVATDPPEAPVFGEVLRRYRLAAGLTQEALAERAGVSVRAITDLERGVNRTPRAATRQLLATALQLSAAERASWEAAARWRPGTGRHAAAGVRDLRDLRASAPPLVGRETELALLARHLTGVSRAGAGAPLLLLAGEPGIGKTRLLDEAARLGAAHGLRVLQGGCQQRDGREPYAPVLHALTRLLRRASPAQLRRDLRGCAWLVRLLPELATAPIEPLPAAALPPAQERRLTFDAVARFLGNVAGPAGTLLLLDDLQWAGDDALDLVRSLAHATAEVPLRLIGTYRQTDVQPNDSLAALLADLASAGRATQRHVGPLVPAEATQLLDALLGEATDEEKRERLLRRTGGVPFFLISCAEAIGRAWAQGADPADGVPWTVAQSVRGRLAALPEQTREALGPAALLGRTFSRVALAAALGQAEADALAALEPAVRARLLVEESGDGYCFAHDVVREVVVAELGAGRQALWHRRIATALETGATPGRAAPAEALAYHYARDEAWAEALPHLVRAGAAAAAAYAYQEALDWYAQALDACDRLGDAAAPVAVDVAEKRGLIQLNLMRLPEMRAEFDRMAAAARRLGDRRREGLALIHRGIAAWMDHAFVEAEANWRAALAVGAAFADVRLAAHLFIAHLCFSLGRHDEARPHRRVAALAAAVVDDPYLKAVHGVITALPFWLAGRFAAAVARLERCRDNTWRSGQAVLRSQHMWAEALARAGRGEYAAAQALLREALGANNRCGDALMQGRCLNTLGWIHGELQDWETALALNRQSLAVAQEAHFPDPEVENNARLNVGDALLALGRGDEAAAAFQNVERVVNHPGPKDQCMLWRYAQHLFHSYGELALARGDLDGALAFADECLQRAEATDSRKNVVKARRLRAQVFLARHELAVAEQEIAQALAVARRLGNPPQLWRTYVTLGEVRRTQGRARDALAAYRAALAVVDGVAAGLAGLPLRDTLLSSPHVQDIRRRSAALSP